MSQSPPSMNAPGGGTPGAIDPQATFNVFAMVVLSGTMLVTPFIRLGVGCRYFIGVPTIGAFFGLLFISLYARTNLDRGLFTLLIYVWVTWIPVRVIWAEIRNYFSPGHSQYNGWPLICTLTRLRCEGAVKLFVEPSICFVLSVPWAHRAPVFSGLLFFVGLCLFASHAMSNHLVNRRTQSLIDSELEQRRAIANFRSTRGMR